MPPEVSPEECGDGRGRTRAPVHLMGRPQARPSDRVAYGSPMVRRTSIWRIFSAESSVAEGKPTGSFQWAPMPGYDQEIEAEVTVKEAYHRNPAQSHHHRSRRSADA